MSIWASFNKRLPEKNHHIWIYYTGNFKTFHVDDVFSSCFTYLGSSDEHAILEDMTGNKKVFDMKSYAWLSVPAMVELTI